MSKQIPRLFACLAALMLAGPTAIRADQWPSHPVTIIVPFSAGGSTDLLARVIAQHLQEKFGQPFIVENKSGASGAIGSAAVGKAEPDGYTLLMGTGGSQVTGPLTIKHRPFDPAELIPVALIAKLPGLIVVHPSIPARTIPELIAYLKANPDKLSYGSSGTGTTTHLGMELFKAETGTRMNSCPVPRRRRQCECYRGRARATRDGHHFGAVTAGASGDYSGDRSHESRTGPKRARHSDCQRDAEGL